MSYVELQQKYLNYAGFQGNLNVTVRFAHPSAWDVRDYEARASLIGGKNRENPDLYHFQLEINLTTVFSTT